MTFSPEDKFGSMPAHSDSEEDFDSKWGTGELSLEGEVPTKSGEVLQDEPTIEELGNTYRVEEPVSGSEAEARVPVVLESVKNSPEDTARLVKEANQEQIEATALADEYKGEAEYALRNGDIEGFKVAYQKVTEARIADVEAEISGLEASFAGGNFQNRGSSEDPNVKSTYEYQVTQAQNKIKDLKKRLERAIDDPNSVAFSEGWAGVNGRIESGDVSADIRRLISEAEKYQKEEDKGYSFVPYNSRLVGLLKAVLKKGSANIDRNTKSAIKSAGQEVRKLPPDLKEQINNL